MVCIVHCGVSVSGGQLFVAGHASVGRFGDEVVSDGVERCVRKHIGEEGCRAEGRNNDAPVCVVGEGRVRGTHCALVVNGCEWLLHQGQLHGRSCVVTQGKPFKVLVPTVTALKRLGQMDELVDQERSVCDGFVRSIPIPQTRLHTQMRSFGGFGVGEAFASVRGTPFQRDKHPKGSRGATEKVSHLVVCAREPVSRSGAVQERCAEEF